jgi:hypothetical protein
MKKIALVGLAFPVLLASVPVVAVPAVQHSTTGDSQNHRLSKVAKPHKLSKTSKVSKWHRLQPAGCHAVPDPRPGREWTALEGARHAGVNSAVRSLLELSDMLGCEP